MAGLDIAGILKTVRLFHSLNSREIKELQDGLVQQRFAAGKCLMRAGEAGKEFFIIISGKCEVITPNGDKVAELVPFF